MADDNFVPQDLPETGKKAGDARSRAYAAPTALQAGLGRKCPQCGRGKLYGGLLAVKDECEVCGLDYSRVDSGDGPAVFVILFLGFVVVVGALLVDSMFAPPYWVHAIIWGPVITLGSLGLLSVFKATLIALQYQNKAHEGRLEQKEESN